MSIRISSLKKRAAPAAAQQRPPSDGQTTQAPDTSLLVLGSAPGLAMGHLYQTMAHSVGIMFENAVANQQRQNAIAQAAATQGVQQILSINTIADAIAIAKMLKG